MSQYPTISQIQLEPMSGLTEVGCSSYGGGSANLKQAVDSEDDWTGVTDGAARRKRQNRLNVRAYRKQNVFHTQLVFREAQTCQNPDPHKLVV